MVTDPNIEALTTILSTLRSLDAEEQRRTLLAVATFLGIPLGGADRVLYTDALETENQKKEVMFSEDRAISPKEFLRDKSPKTDIERVTCLAYYLTHYRDTPHFKTVDLSTLNTEAAQPKLSNPTVAVDNATKNGYLVQAVRGSKQISAVGETFVLALPDRDKARASVANMKIKRRVKRPTVKISNTNNL